MERQHRHRRAQADPLRSRRDVVQDPGGVRGQAVPREVMLSQPDRVHADGLGVQGLFDRLVEPIQLIRSLRPLHGMEQSEAHLAFSQNDGPIAGRSGFDDRRALAPNPWPGDLTRETSRRDARLRYQPDSQVLTRGGAEVRPQRMEPSDARR